MGTGDVRFVPLLLDPCALAREPRSSVLHIYANFGIKYGFYNKWVKMLFFTRMHNNFTHLRIVFFSFLER
jgi:hypothetical protein